MAMVLAILSFLSIFSFTVSFGQLDDYEWPGPEYSVVGDPGMRNSNLRLAIDSWNYCNKVGSEAPKMGSPAAADCFDVHPKTFSVRHRVTEADNRLSVGKPFPSSFRGQHLSHLNDPDLYAVQKELYLGSKCEVHGNDLRFISDYYQFWMITLRNGNLDTHAGLCPSKGRKVGPFEHSEDGFSCFGKGCMNQHMRLTIVTVHLAMLNTFKSYTNYATLTAIQCHRRLLRYYLIRFGNHMDSQRSKEMDGSVIQGSGS
uniref:DUF7705 domain-containing protein n=1 Tax=Nelumbo nucifera TaxID=4432 RepID=A0A822ZKI0_NELNU|nr:TPA_asm: hypothetical protein HUJ06_002090 [Nelumbo nucifera]DAD43869.1 TPA_asm: hypothetical protein HUJ06_002099 [Nelumbo nucifera]